MGEAVEPTLYTAISARRKAIRKPRSTQSPHPKPGYSVGRHAGRPIVPDDGHMLDRVVRVRIRPDFPVPCHTVLRHTDSHSYLWPDMSYHTAGSEQILELEMMAGRSAYGVKPKSDRSRTPYWCRRWRVGLIIEPWVVDGKRLACNIAPSATPWVSGRRLRLSWVLGIRLLLVRILRG